MPSMSYCRYQNAATDIEYGISDCVDGDKRTVSSEEFAAIQRIIESANELEGLIEDGMLREED